MLKNIIIICKKEFSDYATSPMGYIVAIIFAFFANFLFAKDLFLRSDGSLRVFFDYMPILLLIYIPSVTMRTLAEEKKSRTIETLLALPVGEFEIVVGKILGTVMFVGVALLATLSVVAGTVYLAPQPFAEILWSYLGVLLLAGAYVSIGVFVSSLSENQVVALLSTCLTLLLMVLLGSEFLTGVLPARPSQYLLLFSPGYHLSAFLKGILDFRSVFYFFSLIIGSAIMTTIILKKRN